MEPVKDFLLMGSGLGSLAIGLVAFVLGLSVGIWIEGVGSFLVPNFPLIVGGTALMLLGVGLFCTGLVIRRTRSG